MSSKMIVAFAALLLFTGGAIAGSRTAPPVPRPPAAPAPAPAPTAILPEDGPAPPAKEVAVEESPKAVMDRYKAVASDRKLWGDTLNQKLPETRKFTEAEGLHAKDRYLEELAAGRIDADWLWIVFRCGGRGLSQFLLERLADGVADPKERVAIGTEIDRFLLPSSKSIGLAIDDSVLAMAQAKALHSDPLERSIAARLLGTRDQDVSRNALWSMAEGEKDSDVQVAIVESLAPIAAPTIEIMNRFAEVVRAFWGNERSSPRGGKLERLIGAQTRFTKRCEEEYFRQNPSQRR